MYLAQEPGGGIALDPGSHTPAHRQSNGGGSAQENHQVGARQADSAIAFFIWLSLLFLLVGFRGGEQDAAQTGNGSFFLRGFQKRQAFDPGSAMSRLQGGVGEALQNGGVGF